MKSMGAAEDSRGGGKGLTHLMTHLMPQVFFFFFFFYTNEYLVRKIQFNVSVIVTPDGIIGYHRA